MESQRERDLERQLKAIRAEADVLRAELHARGGQTHVAPYLSKLTPMQARIVGALAGAYPYLLTVREILVQMGEAYRTGRTARPPVLTRNNFNVHLSNIRRTLGAEAIINARPRGYKLSPAFYLGEVAPHLGGGDELSQCDRVPVGAAPDRRTLDATLGPAVELPEVEETLDGHAQH